MELSIWPCCDLYPDMFLQYNIFCNSTNKIALESVLEFHNLWLLVWLRCVHRIQDSKIQDGCHEWDKATKIEL